MIAKIPSMDKKILFFVLILCSIIYLFIAVTSHNHFQTFGWDLGYFDQLIWKVAHGIYPFSTLSYVNLLSGHFSPILFLFAPLYWIWLDPRILLIAQTLLVVFAAWPLYLLAYYKTKNISFSFAIVFSYLFFIGTQWSMLNEFHEATIAPLFLVLILYALEKKKNILFWLGIIGLLCIKEEMAPLVAAIGLTVIFRFKMKKRGLFIFIFSFMFFFFLTNIFMPIVSEKGIYQHPHLSSSAKTPSEFSIKLVTDPLFAVKSIITPLEKIKTLMVTLLSFALLPIFAPLSILFPLLEQFLMRFLYTGPQFTVWQNVNHHAAPAAILLPIASIYGAIALGQRLSLPKRKLFMFLAVILLVATISQDIILKAPVHSIFKRQFYETLPWMKDNNVILEDAQKIPAIIPIAAQNSMFPHLSQREKIYLLPELKDAQYLVVDLHDGPNKYAPISHKEMTLFIKGLINESRFKVVKQQGEAILLQRNNL